MLGRFTPHLEAFTLSKTHPALHQPLGAEQLRDELLAVEVFHSLLEAKIMAEDHRQHYTAHRPHSSLGYLTPDEFVLRWTNTNPGLTTSLAH
jgi:transposase InsO family protein